MEIYLDFDGTVVEHDWPKMGVPVPHAIDIITELQKQYPIVLNTYRANIDNERGTTGVEQAMGYLRANRIKISKVLHQKDMPPTWDMDYFNAIQRIYIDDAMREIGMIPNRIRPTGEMVDWNFVKRELERKNIL